MGIFSSIGAGLGTVFGGPLGGAIGAGLGGLLDLRKAQGQTRRSSAAFNRLVQQYRENMNLRRQALQGMALNQYKIIEQELAKNFQNIFAELDLSEQALDNLIEQEYDKVRNVLEAYKAETDLALASREQRILDDKSVQLAYEQQRKFDAVYGPLEEKLSEFYRELDPEEITRTQVADLRNNLEDIKNSVTKSLALRGLGASSVLAKTLANLEYQTDLEVAKLEQENKFKVAQMQEGYLERGKQVSGQTKMLFNVLQQQQKQFLDLEQKRLETIRQNMQAETNLQQQQAREQIDLGYDFAQKRFGTQTTLAQSRLTALENMYNKRFDAEEDYWDMNAALSGRLLGIQEQNIRKAQEDERSIAENLGQLIGLGIELYGKKRGEE